MDTDGGLVIFEVDAEEEGADSGISAISLSLHEDRGLT
jgi:hypothetical protein